MKVLILACLMALALAGEKEEFSVSSETVENLSRSEESITHTNKQKSENFENGNQQKREDERQDKIHSFVQPQPIFYPYAEPIPYTVLPQNVLPLAQSAMVLPILQPQVLEVPITKETIFPKRNVMPLLKSPGVPLFEHKIPTLTDLKNSQLPLPLLQSLMHQVPQPLLQTPMFPTQPLLSLPQSKVLPLSQHVLTYPPRNMPIQEPLLDPTQGFYPVTQPIFPIYNLQQV